LPLTSYSQPQVFLGDDTLSVLEIWGAEYQENNALLIRAQDREILEAVAKRENCPIRILGEITGDGKVVVNDSQDNSTPVDLPLELVLGKMPQKTFVDKHTENTLQPFVLPEGVTIANATDRVLRLLSVGSKRFLIHKVDRSVTGLVAQQQCVGPLQLPLANVAVTAHTHFGTTGTAVACGEQPIKGLVNSAAMARMTVAETMTNLMWARISAIEDIKCSGNWMFAAKLPGEGAKMYDACEALRGALLALGVGIDGGKDSLSMAATCGDELVKAPGELTISAYVTCPDITKTVTPDLKCPAEGSRLLYIDLGGGKARLGGSALAQVYNQIGNESHLHRVWDGYLQALLGAADLTAARQVMPPDFGVIAEHIQLGRLTMITELPPGLLRQAGPLPAGGATGVAPREGGEGSRDPVQVVSFLFFFSVLIITFGVTQLSQRTRGYTSSLYL
jgi:phosphoribosylformylglycinamidine synthase